MHSQSRTAAARVHRQPAHCEPLWRYQDLAPALPDAPCDNAESEDDEQLQQSSRRSTLRCLLVAPLRSAR